MLIWIDGRSPNLGSPARATKGSRPRNKSSHNVFRRCFFYRKQAHERRQAQLAEMSLYEQQIAQQLGVPRVQILGGRALNAQELANLLSSGVPVNAVTAPEPPPVEVRNADGSINRMFSGPIKNGH